MSCAPEFDGYLRLQDKHEDALEWNDKVSARATGCASQERQARGRATRKSPGTTREAA
jgi:hypothetical protein